MKQRFKSNFSLVFFVWFGIATYLIYPITEAIAHSKVFYFLLAAGIINPIVLFLVKDRLKITAIAFSMAFLLIAMIIIRFCVF